MAPGRTFNLLGLGPLVPGGAGATVLGFAAHSGGPAEDTMRPTRTFGLLSTAALATSSALALALSGPAAAAPITESFPFEGAPDSYEVPAGICFLTLDAQAGAGGS